MTSIASISGTFELAERLTAGVGSNPVTVAEAFRTALDALMKARGLKGVDVTRATGLSSATITKLKNGERGASFEVLEQLRAFFGVTPAALFDSDAALATLGLVRRETDTTGQPLDTHGAPVVSSASPRVGVEGGAAVQHQDAELLLALLAYWDAVSPEARLELFLHGRQLRAAAADPVGFRRA